MRIVSEEKTWLDGLSGWEPEGNSVATCWCGDPAVDEDRSDLEAYYRTLDRSALAIRPGMNPVRMIVRLPTPAEWGNILPLMGAGASGDLGAQISAAIVAFELCVRFPDVASAVPRVYQGLVRLPQALLRGLLTQQPQMIPFVGAWIISKYILSEDEKKTSSPMSTEKTSAAAASTSAAVPPESSGAPTAPSGSTAAPTSPTTHAPAGE
jgi:hypothetical protein